MADAALARLRQLMRRLRDPEHGCPWDRQQDFASIVPHTLEECYELADTIARKDYAHLRDELGDLLFQVIFYNQLAEEQGLFDLEQVIEGLIAKLLRRHPHVFPDGTLESRSETPGDEDTVAVKQRWEAIKASERQQKQQTSILDDIPLNLPALSRARKLQQRAARVGFDWHSVEGVLAKLQEELQELEQARDAANPDHIAEELGDLLFSCVNLSRHLGLDAESVLRQGNRKFEQRFRQLEQRLQALELQPEQLGLEQLEAHWQAVKTAED